MKKFGNKDLPIKPGEMIDVIVHPVDDKLICRNSEGKCKLIEDTITVLRCTLQPNRKPLLNSLSLFQLAMCLLLIWSSKYNILVQFYFYFGAKCVKCALFACKHFFFSH